MKYLITTIAMLTSACSTPANLAVYTPSEPGRPGLLTSTSTDNEAADFRSLFAAAKGICLESRVRVSSWSGSCSEIRCYRNLGFDCKEDSQ